MHRTSTAPVSQTRSKNVFQWTLPWQLTNDKKVHSAGFYRQLNCPKFRLPEAVTAKLTLAAGAPNPWPLLVNMKWGGGEGRGDSHEERMWNEIASGPLTFWGFSREKHTSLWNMSFKMSCLSTFLHSFFCIYNFCSIIRSSFKIITTAC